MATKHLRAHWMHALNAISAGASASVAFAPVGSSSGLVEHPFPLQRKAPLNCLKVDVVYNRNAKNKNLGICHNSGGTNGIQRLVMVLVKSRNFHPWCPSSKICKEVFAKSLYLNSPVSL